MLGKDVEYAPNSPVCTQSHRWKIVPHSETFTARWYRITRKHDSWIPVWLIDVQESRLNNAWSPTAPVVPPAQDSSTYFTAPIYRLILENFWVCLALLTRYPYSQAQKILGTSEHLRKHNIRIFLKKNESQNAVLRAQENKRNKFTYRKTTELEPTHVKDKLLKETLVKYGKVIAHGGLQGLPNILLIVQKSRAWEVDGRRVKTSRGSTQLKGRMQFHLTVLWHC